MTVTEISTKSQFDDLLKQSPYVALQAHASWCGPCKAMSPIFSKQSDSHGTDKYSFAKFDTDEVSDLAQELGVRSIPAFFFFKDGELVDQVGGANPPALTKSVTALAEQAKAAGGDLKTDDDF